MKRCLLLSASLILLAALSGTAQQKQIAFEQANARVIEPEMKVYVHPLIAEIDVLDGQERQDYGPYLFEIPSYIQKQDLTVFQAWLNDKKNAALYQAMREGNSDMILAALFYSYVEKDAENVVKIELSGFPAKIKKFRPVTDNDSVKDYDMIRIAYPASSNKFVEEAQKTKATEMR